jgi:hypothetical protein
LLPDRAIFVLAFAKVRAARLGLAPHKALPMKKLGKMYRRRGENFPDSALALLNKLPSNNSTPSNRKDDQRLKSPGQKQYQQNDNDQAESTARVVTPVPAMRPGW